MAYDIFSASFSQTSADARLALLMIALESRIELGSRGREAQDVVESLIDRVRESGLPVPEVESMVGSLR